MKRILLPILLALIITQYSSAQFALTEYTANNLPTISQGATAMADVDNDNDLDIFISGNNNGTYIAKIYLNDGTGLYSESIQNIFTGASLSTASFADVDNDNDQDLLYLGLDSAFNRITKLYINNGSGVFVEDTSNNFTGLTRGSITFGDIDNDNDEDLILAGEIGATSITKLYSNDGSGIFTEVVTAPFDNVSAGDISFSDIDNDNDLDLFGSLNRNEFLY